MATAVVVMATAEEVRGEEARVAAKVEATMAVEVRAAVARVVVRAAVARVAARAAEREVVVTEEARVVG
jgi:hypothetical protein